MTLVRIGHDGVRIRLSWVRLGYDDEIRILLVSE